MSEDAKLQLGSRALANVLRGLGASLPFALLVPLLAHRLTADNFAVWVLVVQVASYVNYLEFGVQTAVSRTVAFRFASGDPETAAGPMSAGVRLLIVMGLGGLVLVVATAIVLPEFVSIPDGLVTTSRVALIILGGAASIALPGSAMHGALVGAGRHWWSAITVVASRSISVAVTVYGAYQGWSITTLAACLAAGSLANGIGPFLAARRVHLPSPWNTPSVRDRHEIRGITTTVGTWTIATLIITGIDVLVVGIVDFDLVSSYGLASSLTLIAIATYGILSSILIPAFANQAARTDSVGAKYLLARTTAASCGVLAVGLIVALMLRGWVLSVWAGSYDDDAMPIFVVLVITATVRLSMSPIGSFVMGYGDHRTVRLPAIVESVLNLGLSIAFGIAFGAIGVAIASLVASGAALVLYLGKVGPDAVGRVEFRRVVLPQYVLSAGVAAPFVFAMLLDDRSVDRLVIGCIGVVAQLLVLRSSLAKLSSGPSTSPPDIVEQNLRGESGS